MEEADFWSDPDKASKLLRDTKKIKTELDAYNNLNTLYEDIDTLIDIAYEENDES